MTDGLYDARKPNKLKGKEISSSNSLSFSSNLSSLISSSASKKPGNKKPVSTKGKSDIFTAHNKNVKKRASKDLEDENGQRHKTKDDVGAVSSADLHRSKRRMEEKVRLYNAMKRGEYVQRGDGYDDRGLVDFDRKWADKPVDNDDSDQSDFSDEAPDENPDNNEVIEYTDEFGRLRKGTRKEAERKERQARIQAIAKADAENFAARPQAPASIIHGDAVQHEAFNPDRTIAEQMAELAKKRDKSATPPPATHFDATAEIRTKGTGFYNFSHNAEERQREMEELEKVRQETESKRKERQQQSEVEESLRHDTQPSKTDAERFLEDFTLPDD